MRLEDLEYVGVVGEGSFCIVKKYQDSGSKIYYAQKKIISKHYGNTDYADRFRQEIKILCGLKECTHIIDVIDFNIEDDIKEVFLLMPYAEFNLRKFINANNTKLTFTERCEIFEQIVAALKYAHARDILHRDLAPENILLFLENGKILVRVSDFGLGKDLSTLTNLTTSSVNSYGHYDYTAPEQLVKLKDASFRSDIYSLGQICYFIFTGKRPVHHENFEFSTLLKKAIAHNPNDRYQEVSSLEQKYFELKQIQQTMQSAKNVITLQKFLASGSSINYTEFHERMKHETEFDDIHEEFLLPITNFLLLKNNLRDYHNHIKENFTEFMELFFIQYSKLPAMGWDFKILNEYSMLMEKIIEQIPIPETRLICFKLLFKMAYDYSNFRSQNLLEIYLVDKYLTDEIVAGLAEFLIENNYRIELKHFKITRMPATLRTLLEQIVQQRAEREAHDRDKYTEDGFI